MTILTRLLTDQSSELQEALRQLLFKDNEPRWERLQVNNRFVNYPKLWGEIKTQFGVKITLQGVTIK